MEGSTVYWRVLLTHRQHLLALLDQIAQVRPCPLAGAVVLPEGPATLFLRDGQESPALRRLLRPIGQPVAPEAVACAVWAAPALLRRALAGRPPAPPYPMLPAPAPRPPGQRITAQVRELSAAWPARWTTLPVSAPGLRQLRRAILVE